jgi:iron complex outermembrane recepter protein
MRSFAALLLASTCLFAAPAAAQEGGGDELADDVAAESASGDGGPTIVVFGKGETRQVQELDTADITILTPGSSPLKAIEKLPSVNVQNSDPFGAYEWSQRVSIRSFNQNQIGHNFDGIPLGDMSYGNHNGLHLSRAVSPENVGSVVVSQGAGSVGAQATNNLGGTIETYSIDPEAGLASMASGTYGSDDTWRVFGRLNAASPGGVRGFVSYAYASTDKWRGEGLQTQHLVNAKVVVPVDTAELDFWFSYSDRREQDYQDMSLEMIERLGWRWDNTFSDYARAILYADIANNRGDTGAPVSNPAAGTVYPDNVVGPDDAYYDASGLRKDALASVGLTAPVGDNVEVRLKGYVHHDEGVGTWATPYVPSPNAPISMRTTEYDMDRFGAFGSVNLELGMHELTAGFWAEKNEFNQARRFHAHPSRTEPLDYRKFPDSAFLTQWEFDYTTRTLQYYVQDRVELGDLTLNLGWKGFTVENKADAILAGGFPEGKLETEDWFQPHAGFAWDITDEAQLFGGFTQVTRAFITANGGPFGTTAAAFELFKDDIKPESSDTYELGLRYADGPFNGVLGAYYVTFHDRLLGIRTGPDIQGNPSILQNVGAVETYGFEAAGNLRLGAGFGIYAAYSYIHAEYADDVINRSGQLVAATDGKTVVDVPRHMIDAELTYDSDTGFFGRIGVGYMSRRYYSYLNDASVPGRTLVEAALGYRINDNFEVQLNGSNLTDEDYISTVGSAGLSNSGDGQTLLIGAPRQLFATLRVTY